MPTSTLLQYFVAFIEVAIALGTFVLLCWFVRRLFRGRPPEEPDEGEPFAGVTAPLGPSTPRKRAKATAELPDDNGDLD